MSPVCFLPQAQQDEASVLSPLSLSPHRQWGWLVGTGHVSKLAVCTPELDDKTLGREEADPSPMALSLSPTFQVSTDTSGLTSVSCT